MRIPFILASQSPRRSDLLREAGYSFEVVASDAEEAFDTALTPPELTCANATLKARTVAQRHPERFVIGADTLVYLDGKPFGKPVDLDDAAQMLQQLVGRTHQVCTGVALHCANASLEETFHVITQVTFLPLGTDAIFRYLKKINPLDKAGGYAAQEHGGDIIARTEGSWSNVVGLPMEALADRLATHGIYK